MDWMAETFARRVDPKALMAEAQSVVMLALNYGPDGDPLAALRRARTPARFRSMPAIATTTTSSRAS